MEFFSPDRLWLRLVPFMLAIDLATLHRRRTYARWYPAAEVRFA
jgi:hypothetical protein